MGIAKKKPAVIKDSIGDMAVVAIMLQGLSDRDGTLTNITGFDLFCTSRCVFPKPCTYTAIFHC